MRIEIVNEVYVLPAYWASYLVNGDDSGLSESDRRQANEFCTRKGLKASDCVCCSEEQYFQWGNDYLWSIGGDVLEFTFHRQL